jgi:hypothetical protein
VIEDRQAKKTDVAAQKKAREERQNTIAARERGLGELHAKYMELALNPDGAQQRGYDLQDLLKGLFKLHDILYQPPYRKGTVEETDGFFTFRGFDYLLNARSTPHFSFAGSSSRVSSRAAGNAALSSSGTPKSGRVGARIPVRSHRSDCHWSQFAESRRANRTQSRLERVKRVSWSTSWGWSPGDPE